MADDRWQELDAAFDAALELEGEDRRALLRGLGERDPELRRGVERLLALELEAGALLSGPAMLESFGATGLGGDLLGSRIGPYRLVSLLGQGGMGQVYLAERADEQFEQQVAIKILAGPGTPGLLRRFRTERQILARFEHPWIARLLDGGVADDGRLYLVLEYVDGVPIDRFCRERGLGLEERLRLFLDVCTAVTYAHQQLIVHRDLKPANILVTDDGTPKLLDFGIAKVLDPGQFPHQPTQTHFSQRPLTLQYASPEQVTGGAITTATDVYGLGLLLYELVTGGSPFPVGDLSTGEAERRICHAEPPPASVLLAERAAEKAAENSPGERLPIQPHQLKGDLDHILVKALDKSSSRRYSSIRHFAEDLERHLERRPISAGAGGWLYRATRFVQRQALAVGLVSALFSVLIGFLWMQSLHGRQLARERDEAQAARDRAEQVARYLREVFSSADPEAARGNPPTARELLEKGANQALAELDDDPTLQSELMLIMADTHAGLGLHSEAIELYQTARHKLQRLLGATHPKIAEASAALGDLWWWRGDDARAEAFLREALALRSASLGARHPETLESLSDLAQHRVEQGLYDEARELFERVLQAQQEVLGRSHLSTLRTQVHLGLLWADVGDRTRAAENLRQALPVLREALGEDHPEVATALHNLGGLESDPKEAERRLTQALEIRRRLYDDDDPRTAKTRSNLVVILTRLKDPRATTLAQEELALRRKRLGNDHPQIGHALAILGEALYQAGRIEEGLATFRQSIAHVETSLGPDHPKTAYPVSRLGNLLVEQGRAREAEQLLRRAVTIRERAMDPDAPLLLRSKADLEACLSALQRADPG